MSADRCEQFGYQPLDRWERLLSGWSWYEATAVAVDSRDRVFVFNRGEHPVMVFDPDGTLVDSWGAGLFARPHGICIAPDDTVYCTDDGGHCIHRFTPDGTLLATLGTPGRPSDTGATSVDYRTIRQAAGPFHYPTNLAVAPSGEVFVADGYGNARVHKFSADGRLLHSWGQPGEGPGEFRVPHGIAVDAEGRVLVADRENSRIQLFSADGEYLTSWTDVARPCQVFVGRDAKVYVAELGYRAGMWPGTTAPRPNATGGRVSIFDSAGTLLARWGGGTDPCAAGDFFAPHGICVDSQGAMYVAEVVMSAGGDRGLVSSDCPSLQKFVRSA